MSHNLDTLLIPKSSIEYFKDATDINQKLYFRAVGIRFCLENIIDTVFLHISGINEVGKVKIKWKKSTSDQKIKMLEDYFPNKIFDKIIYINRIGNKGGHQGSHELIKNEDIKLSLEYLSQICEWRILSYFKKYGFDVHPWLPTLLSTLPPVNRIRILEELLTHAVELVESTEDLETYQSMLALKQIGIDTGDPFSPYDESFIFGGFSEESLQKYGQLHLIVDKLALAYLKNNEFEKSNIFIKKSHDKRIIGSNYRDCMLLKINELNKEIGRFKISRSIEDAKSRYKELLPAVKAEEKSLFITIFTAVLAVSEYE